MEKVEEEECLLVQSYSRLLSGRRHPFRYVIWLLKAALMRTIPPCLGLEMSKDVVAPKAAPSGL